MKRDLLGRKEAAELLGVSTQRLAQMMERYDDFPEPVAHISAGMIWERKDLEDWAHMHGRRVGGPRLIDVLAEEDEE